MNPVFLHLAGSDLIDGEVPKKRHQMDTQANGVALGPLFAAFTLGDDSVLFDKLVGSLPERRAGFEDACAELSLKGQIPVLGDLARLREGFLFGAELELLSADRCPGLPEPARAALVDLKFPIHEVDGRHKSLPTCFLVVITGIAHRIGP